MRLIVFKMFEDRKLVYLQFRDTLLCIIPPVYVPAALNLSDITEEFVLSLCS
jgi:hypothetical protein